MLYAYCAQMVANPTYKPKHWTLQNALRHWGDRMGLERREDKLRERPIVLRKRRERIKSEANWSLFYYKFTQDHALPNLIWNHKVSAASSGRMRKVTVQLFICSSKHRARKAYFSVEFCASCIHSHNTK